MASVLTFLARIPEDFVDDLCALTPKWPGWLRKTISSLAGAKEFIP